MKKYSSLIVVVGLIVGLALTVPAFAQTSQNAASQSNALRHGTVWMSKGMGQTHRMPGVFGTVSAINGTTITVTGKAGPREGQEGTATTYTVDATNAKVTKNGTTSSLSNIAVGDTIMVQGTVDGSNVTATEIRDGFGEMRTAEPRNPPKNPVIQGNGEPVIGGSVSTINDMTLTITNKSNIVYTVDATNASIIKMGTSTTISNVAVGDNLVIQGTVNGTSVTASSIIDQGAASAASGTPNTSKPRIGFFGAIGNFLSRLFGF